MYSVYELRAKYMYVFSQCTALYIRHEQFMSNHLTKPCQYSCVLVHSRAKYCILSNYSWNYFIISGILPKLYKVRRLSRMRLKLIDTSMRISIHVVRVLIKLVNKELNSYTLNTWCLHFHVWKSMAGEAASGAMLSIERAEFDRLQVCTVLQHSLYVVWSVLYCMGLCCRSVTFVPSHKASHDSRGCS